jgi:hypothetical protein
MRAAANSSTADRGVLDLDRVEPAIVLPNTRRTGPNSQSSRSTVCTPWFISAPPPSSARVPRQRDPA